MQMRSQAKPAKSEKVAASMNLVKIPAPKAEIPHSGILVLDMAFNPLASDRGAAAILDGGNDTPGPMAIPDDVMDVIRKTCAAGHSSVSKPLTIGRNRYFYRTYLIQSDHPTLPPAMIGVYIHAENNGIDPTTKIAAKHRLTEREAQALRGIAMGLSTREMAERMNISPNTVKAFVRLIMIKLGVTTRTAILLKILGKEEPE